MEPVQQADAYVVAHEPQDGLDVLMYMRDHALPGLTPIFFKHPDDLDGGPPIVVGWMVDSDEAIDVAEMLSDSFRGAQL